MRWVKSLLIAVLFLALVIHLFIYRSILSSKFDADYWRVKYEQSQWLLPLSWRTIGDNGLYLYEGYKIIHGYDPTLVNAEVPPLPKYLIGLSVLLFGNGNWYGVIFTVGSVIIFYLLSVRLLKNTIIALVISALFALDPLLSEQFTLTMLDSVQLFFLLLFLYAFSYLHENFPGRRLPVYVFVLGALLGLFSSTRYPVLTPILLFLGSVLLWQRLHKGKFIVIFLTATLLFYLVPYIRYFALGHSVIDWFGVQKWIYHFYRSSKLAANTGSIWTTLMGNSYRNLFTHVFERVPEWSPLWPLVTVAGLMGFLKALFIKTKHPGSSSSWKLIGFFLILTMVIYSFIPFWTRYLLLVLPLLYLGFGYLIKEKTPMVVLPVFGLLLCINMIATAGILLPTPESTVKQFFYDWNNGFFHDMYESVDRETKNHISRIAFTNKGLTFMRDGEIEHIQVEAANVPWSRFISPQYVPVRIVYATRNLGTFTEEALVPVVNEDNQWVIKWNWNLFISQLPEDGKLETTAVPARRGSIIGADKKILTGDFQSYMVWITPELVDHAKEEEMLGQLEKLFLNRLPKAFLHHRYVFNTDPAYPVPVGVLPELLDEKMKAMLRSYPGLMLTPAYGRNDIFFVEKRMEGHVENSQFLECCSRLYSTTTYDGASGIEKEQNIVLKGVNGGKLLIINPEGKTVRILIYTEKRDGINVQI